MKHMFTIISLACAALMSPAFSSCGGDDPDTGTGTTQTEKANVTVSCDYLIIGADRQTQDFTVTADRDWAVRTEADWISLSPAGGVKDKATKVEVSVTENTAMTDRNADVNIVIGGKTVKTLSVTQLFHMQASADRNSINAGGQGLETTINITSNCDWTLTSSETWVSASPASGKSGETAVTVKVGKNETAENREATLTLSFESGSSEIKVTQLSDEIVIPEGYALVWNDEFNEGTELGSDWTHEVQNQGWVNNELQNYIKGSKDGMKTTELKDGFLNINCFKASDGKVYSGRVYAHVNSGWQYGYFEARINLPKGKGTWPAFWMMPVGNDWNTNPWPKCGEIDIMEEVGTVPNEVSSSLHTEKYNHTKNTQKTHAMKIANAEGEFHTYAVEWTEDAITTYVDGKVQLKATKAEMGSDHDSWPFHYAFYPILNLAWGGDWGGMNGVDESVLPVTMKVDYLRVFQKK